MSDSDPYANDPFKNDPQFINRDQFGENIDPYSRGVSIRDRERELEWRRNQSLYDQQHGNYSGGNQTFYEYFNLFESTPKYGIHHNLMFQDTTRRFKPLQENQQTYTGYLGE